MRNLLFLVVIVFSSFKTFAFDVTGLEISLAGDMVYSHGLNSNSGGDEKMTMRGAEMMFYAPIDHNFEGVLSAAAHDENGETVFELHELFLSSNKLIPSGRFKIGKFFLGVGRLNTIHQHDWPFIRAPKVHETFFDSEGVFDSGAEFGYLLPVPFYLDLTLGLTSGYNYGHSHTSGSKPKVPTHYLHLETFKEFSSTSGLKFGINYLGRTDEQENRMHIFGFDLTSKSRAGKAVSYLFQTESWLRVVEDAFGSYNRQAGLYIFNQFALTQSTYFGLRLDGFKELSKVNAISGEKINNVTYAVVPEYTWKSSEFATIRTGLSHEFTREEGLTHSRDTRLEMQFIFILGAHPAHNF